MRRDERSLRWNGPPPSRSLLVTSVFYALLGFAVIGMGVARVPFWLIAAVWLVGSALYIAQCLVRWRRHKASARIAATRADNQRLSRSGGVAGDGDQGQSRERGLITPGG
jgi:hypothetical protein